MTFPASTRDDAFAVMTSPKPRHARLDIGRRRRMPSRRARVATLVMPLAALRHRASALRAGRQPRLGRYFARCRRETSFLTAAFSFRWGQPS